MEPFTRQMHLPGGILMLGGILMIIDGSINTPITGFGARLSIVGNICLLYFINELGLLLINPKKKNYEVK